MNSTKYDESFYYSAARLDALDRRMVREENKRAARTSVHSLTVI